jgi:hypothetical protein
MSKLICNKSKSEIKKKITEICNDRDNFTTDNFRSEAADNGNFEINFSEFTTEDTLNKFVEWLFKK